MRIRSYQNRLALIRFKPVTVQNHDLSHLPSRISRFRVNRNCLDQFRSWAISNPICDFNITVKPYLLMEEGGATQRTTTLSRFFTAKFANWKLDNVASCDPRVTFEIVVMLSMMIRYR